MAHNGGNRPKFSTYQSTTISPALSATSIIPTRFFVAITMSFSLLSILFAHPFSLLVGIFIFMAALWALANDIFLEFRETGSMQNEKSAQKCMLSPVPRFMRNMPSINHPFIPPKPKSQFVRYESRVPFTPLEKFSTAPSNNKGFVKLPRPMSMEQSTQALEKLGIYSDIQQLRGKLRQWFSMALLNPLVYKIESSHRKVITAGSKIGLSINHAVNQVGSRIDCKEGCWQSRSTIPDEDCILQNFLAQSRNVVKIPAIEEFVNSVGEHLRLRALMAGKWMKGLLPHSPVRAEYSVERIKQLAQGTCVKEYEFVERFTSGYSHKEPMPSDSHILLYLFCAFLKHPHWKLYPDPISSPLFPQNALYVGETLPQSLVESRNVTLEYIAVLSSVPSVMHRGATILVIGKQTFSMSFSIYWDQRRQFCLQGISSFWDAILILCHRIKVAHRGVINGISLGAFSSDLFSLDNF